MNVEQGGRDRASALPLLAGVTTDCVGESLVSYSWMIFKVMMFGVRRYREGKMAGLGRASVCTDGQGRICEYVLVLKDEMCTSTI
jgi:hypothetical protein